MKITIIIIYCGDSHYNKKKKNCKQKNDTHNKQKLRERWAVTMTKFTHIQNDKR